MEIMFREVVGSLPMQQCALLLRFWSGLWAYDGEFLKSNPLVVQYCPDMDARYLPVAHTCFATLDLPPYTDRETIKAKLLRAIVETQFGIV
jgi:hypothetical protein